jgi:hypothetical protein
MDMKHTLVQILQILIFLFIGCSHPQQNDKTSDCYEDSIKLIVDLNQNIIKDTVINFRNYISNDSSKRIICNQFIPNQTIEKLIWESQYLQNWLTYNKRINKCSILSLEYLSNNQILARHYLCDITSKETFEKTRFLIRNNEIIGINIFPGISEEFVPIEEFNAPQNVEY